VAVLPVPLSFREVEELMLERGVTVSYESIRRWCLKFGQAYANSLRRRRPRPGDKWHLDEVFIKINGEQKYAALATLQTSGIGAASVAAAGGLAYGLLTRERREPMREWVGPLHQALAIPLGIAEQTDPRRYLHVPKNFSDDDAEIRVDLPVSLRFSRDVVADLITQKLALEGVTFSWHPAGRKPYVLVKKTRKPPKKAAFKDPKVRELVAKAPESAPLIGIGTGGKTVAVDWTPNHRTSSSTRPRAAASR
jgi:hypothetical protein